MFDQPDLDFARRSIRYMLDNRCNAAEIIDALVAGLSVPADDAHQLLAETAELVAA